MNKEEIKEFVRESMRDEMLHALDQWFNLGEDNPVNFSGMNRRSAARRYAFKEILSAFRDCSGQAMQLNITAAEIKEMYQANAIGVQRVYEKFEEMNKSYQEMAGLLSDAGKMKDKITGLRTLSKQLTLQIQGFEAMLNSNQNTKALSRFNKVLSFIEDLHND